MVRQARVLAQATSDLVNAMRSDAEAEIDMENSKKLLAAAKLLADSTARMVEAAKVVYIGFIQLQSKCDWKIGFESYLQEREWPAECAFLFVYNLCGFEMFNLLQVGKREGHGTCEWSSLVSGADSATDRVPA